MGPSQRLGKREVHHLSVVAIALSVFAALLRTIEAIEVSGGLLLMVTAILLGVRLSKRATEEEDASRKLILDLQLVGVVILSLVGVTVLTLPFVE